MMSDNGNLVDLKEELRILGWKCRMAFNNLSTAYSLWWTRGMPVDDNDHGYKNTQMALTELTKFLAIYKETKLKEALG